MKSILLDCDGVMLDWVGGFKNYLTNNYGIEFTSDLPDDWSMTDWTGLTIDEVRAHVAHFNEEHDDFGKLPPLPGAVEAIRDLYNQGYDMHVISSCSSNVNTVRNRHKNLEMVFGDVFQSIQLVPLRTSKADHLSRFEPSVWVEDNFDNAKLGHELGHHGVVFETPYNIDSKQEALDCEMTWTRNWSEITRAINAYIPIVEPA